MRALIPLLLVAVLLVSTLSFLSLKLGAEVEPQVRRFSSYQELKDFLKERREIYNFKYLSGMVYDFGYWAAGSTPVVRLGTVAQAFAIEASNDGSKDHSSTNIQVQGVDEADIVKTDGEYIYLVSGQSIFIIHAYPAEEAMVLSKIELDGIPQEIFVNKNRLAIFGNQFVSFMEDEKPIVIDRRPLPSGTEYIVPPVSSKAFVKIYDLSDKEDPVLKRDISLDGSYFDSRMIGDYVYVLMNTPVNYDGEEINLPAISSDGEVRTITAGEVQYFDLPDYSYRFTIILAINIQDDAAEPERKVFLMGQTQNMYVSPNNIYVTCPKILSPMDLADETIDAILPVLPWRVAFRIQQVRNSGLGKFEKFQRIGESLQRYFEGMGREEAFNLQQKIYEKTGEVHAKIFEETQKTVIHKISIREGEIKYEASGEVPGYVLNQFSMDEHDGYFRIATTTEAWGEWGQRTTNNIYVLDEGLAVIGELEDLAPGERIFSARFIMDRAYLVTFKKIDPLFVIDLADPSNPRVLGQLKIPGFSDYLHPYDEDHIIGIGKETVEAEEGDFAWFQGIKLAIFDVSDVENPKEKARYIIGDRGTDSYALRDHKAFLFSRERGLLIIPILLAEINEEKYPGGVPPFTIGDYVFQGAYVFDVSLDEGFGLRGRITHLRGEELAKSGFYFSSPYSIQRSLYIEDVLYTFSERMVKMNRLDDLSEINQIELW